MQYKDTNYNYYEDTYRDMDGCGSILRDNQHRIYEQGVVEIQSHFW